MIESRTVFVDGKAVTSLTGTVLVVFIDVALIVFQPFFSGLKRVSLSRITPPP